MSIGTSRSTGLIQIWEEFFTEPGHYRKKVLETAQTGNDLAIDYKAVERFDLDLADDLVDNPRKILQAAEKALHEADLPVAIKDDIKVRVTNLPAEDEYLVRDLRSRHLKRLISVDGIIRKATRVRPHIDNAVFECQRCGEYQQIEQPLTKLKQPFMCRGCERKGPFELLKDESILVDKQKISIQELPEDLRGGAQPSSITAYVAGDLAGTAHPGNRVKLNGAYSSMEATKGNKKLPHLDTYIDTNNLEIQEKEYRELNISPEDRKKIRELKNSSTIVSDIVDSIAPSIYGYDDIKESIALQLFGGIMKTAPDGAHLRGDIHILLIGDPGIGKSQLLRYVKEIAPRGVYASGKSSSAAGLTAAAVKDNFGEGQWTIEAGALVLADKGVACIDELDKMRDEDRSALHEALEQQQLSIAKAGITTTMRTQCSLLAAANPKYGRYDMHEPLADQLNLEPALVSRFDLIFPLRDEANATQDNHIAEHILKNHKGQDTAPKPVIEPDLLRKYIASAKTLKPHLSTDAEEVLKEFYTSVRQEGDGNDSPIPITARQLEALIRLAEASARMKHSSVVEEEDAKTAVRLVRTTLRQVGLDPETGEFDIDNIATGMSKSQREKILLIKSYIREHQGAGKGVSIEDLFAAMEETGMTRKYVKDKLRMMREETGDIYHPGADREYVRLA